MKNNFDFLYNEVCKMEAEVEGTRKTLARKDDTINSQNVKIEQLSRSLEEVSLQKQHLIDKQKDLEDDLQQSRNALNPKGGKNHQNDYLDIFKKKLRELQVTGDIYYDNDFPPEAVSLIEDWNDKGPLTRDLVEEWKQFIWIRTDQIPSFNTGDPEDKLEIFKNGIEAADIQ